MSESLGGISWIVDADTKPATNSIKEMGAQVDNAEVKLLKLDKVTAKYTKTLMKNGNQVSKTGLVLDKYGKVNDHATTRLTNLISQQAKFTKSAAGVNNAVKGMSRNAGMAGIQFQQFIGQIQGGQNAMVALSQQSADLGFVLGAPLVGAIVGITASLAGMLLPALFGGKDALETVAKATENVKAAMTLGADGVADYTEEMKKLKAISSALAEIKIAGLIAEQNEAFKTVIKETTRMMDKARDQFALGQLFGIGKITKSGIAAFSALSQAAKELKLKPTIENINKVESALLGMSRAGVDNTKQGLALTTQLGGLIAAYKKGEISINSLKEALKDTSLITGELDDENKKHASTVESMVKALQEQARAISETNEQTAIRIALDNNATEGQIKAIKAAFKRIKSIQSIEAEEEKSFNAEVAREKARQKAAATTAKAKEKAKAKGTQYAEKIVSRGNTGSAELNKLLEEQAKIDKLHKDGLINEKLYIESKQQIKDDASAMAAESAVSTESPEIIRINTEIEKIAELREAGLISAKEYQDSLTGLEQAGANARMQINAMSMASFSSSFGAIADIMAESKGEQSNEYKAMFALAKGFAVAQAGLNLASAVMTVYNAPDSLTLTSKMINVAAATAAGAGLLSAVSGASYSGRENGGSVMGGQTYEVGEKNKPEMLMIPGNNGKVFSNAEMKNAMGGGGSGAQINQTINNYAAADGYSVQTSGDGVTRPQVIDIIKSEMANSSSHSRQALAGNSNIQNRPRSRR